MHARDFSLDTFLKVGAAQHAHRPAIVDGEQRLTYVELDQRVDKLAHWLLAKGIGAGDRVCILLTDGAPFVTTFLACGRIGAIAVLLNWRLAASEIGWIVDNAEPAMTFYNPRFHDLLSQSQAGELIEVDELHHSDGNFEAIVSQDQQLRTIPDLSIDRPLYMMYTSGTTGRPKGCLQAGSAIATAALGFAVRRGWNKHDRLLSANPIFHILGMQQVATMLACGGCSVFARRDDDSKALLDLLHSEECTAASIFPPFLLPWLEMNPVRDGKMPLNHYTTGGGVGDPAMYEFIEKDWDARVVGGFGQTESCGFATFLDYPDMLEHPKSCGWVMPHVDMAVLDSEGNQLAAGEEGEICLRGPSVMLGYWRNEEATQSTLAHGWLHTGDLGTIDERGLAYILGRKKELIKTGGENVYPAELDAIFAEMPEVLDAGVCGVPHSKWGEAIKAFVVLEPDANLSREEITARFKKEIAGYKRPQYIEFVDELPRDPLGKLQRVELSKRPVSEEHSA